MINRRTIALAIGAFIMAAGVLVLGLVARKRSEDNGDGYRSHIEVEAQQGLTTNLPSMASLESERRRKPPESDRQPSAGVPVARDRVMDNYPDTGVVVEYYRDASTPIDEREERIRVLGELAKNGNREAIDRLIAIADARIYLSGEAIKQLASVGTPETRSFVLEMAKVPDIRRVVAALESIPQALESEDAVSEIAELLEENRSREDGYQERFWAECAEGLAEMAAPAALPLLERELNWVAKDVHYLEYGSKLVSAMQAVGLARGAEALDSYADRLEANLPDEPMPREYFLSKIDEARKAAEEIR